MKHFAILVRKEKGIKTYLVDSRGAIFHYPTKKLAQAMIDDPRNGGLGPENFTVIDMSD